MDLRLKYPPTPGNAKELAATCVDAARRISRLELDYTPGSLKLVDAQLSKFINDGLSSASIGETLFAFGCYVGEVLIRNIGGKWVETEHSRMVDLTPWPIVVQMRNGDCWNPIGKVFKRVDDGEENSVEYLYAVASADQRKPER